MALMWVIPAVRRNRRLRTRLLIACAVVGVAGVILASELSRPLLDDGPFHGRPRVDCPRMKPSYALELTGGMVIESFDAPGSTQGATVRLRDRAGNTKWCVFADATP